MEVIKNVALSLRLHLIPLLAMMLAVQSWVVAQEPEVVVQLGREEIYEGDSVQYSVSLRNFDESARPNLDGFKDFDVRQRSSGVQVSQFGTRVTRTLVFEYQLTPRFSGELEVPGPTAEQDGQVYRGSTTMLTVVAAEDQDIARLEITVSDDEVYPMQPFDVRLTIAVQPLPDLHKDKSPVAVQDPPPRLSIPWADDSKLPEGLLAKIPMQRWLTTIQDAGGGFSVNDVSTRSAFGFNGRLAVFQPKPTRAFRKDSKGRRIEYWEFVFERTFVAERVDQFAFGPVGLKGVFATRATSRGKLEGESIYASAKAVTVRVKDVPTEGTPESYTGAVGTFRIGADISPTEAKVGDPMTLTLWLTGVGTLDQALAPNLEQLDDVADSFKLYDATEETDGSTRRFTYSVRPKHAGVKEVPTIPLSYFDVDKEEFVTLRSDPLAIQISAADHLADGDIAMATAARPTNSDIEVSQDGIFANVTDLRQLRDETVHPDRWFFGLGGLACLFFVVALVTQHVQTLRNDDTLQRRRGAASKVKQRLQDGGGIEEVSAAMLDFVADACGIESQGLTSQDAIVQLREVGVDAQVIDQFAKVMQTCDGARYGAGSEAASDAIQSTRACLDDLLRDLKGRKLLS